MKLIFGCLMGLLADNCFCQVIPVEKAIMLARRPFSEDSDYLYKDGWDYMRPLPDTSKYKITFVWAFKFNKTTNNAASWLWTSREINTDTVFEIKEHIPKADYARTVNELRLLKFKETGTYPHPNS